MVWYNISSERDIRRPNAYLASHGPLEVPLCAPPEFRSLRIERVVRGHDPISLQHNSQIRQSAAFGNIASVLIEKDARNAVALSDDDRDTGRFARHLAAEGIGGELVLALLARGSEPSPRVLHVPVSSLLGT